MQKALLEEAKAQNIKIKFGMKLISLNEEDRSVRLKFANGHISKADFVVGADSIYSKVRSYLVRCELDVMILTEGVRSHVMFGL